ncbi:MAG: hypothetical protein AB7N65_31620 [Vicinamibacterales bacterium]
MPFRLTTSREVLLRCISVVLVVCVTPDVVVAGERYAVIVTGASGGTAYAEKYQKWRTAFVSLLKDSFGYPEDHVVALGEDQVGRRKATRENVKAALVEVRARAVDGDLVLVLLIGHGSADSEDAKFNLVGPDLSVHEWADLVKPIRGRLVFVNGSSGSFPFLAAIAGRNRVVLTANDSDAQQFETRFPEFFINAFTDPAADTDKNGKVSILESFTFASARVKAAFEQKGQLATERALLDDTGGGIGRDADTPGKDGQVAQITYLAPEVPAGAAPEQASLMRRRAELEDRLTVLKSNKDTMPADRYEQELEQILLDIARLDRQLRAKT